MPSDTEFGHWTNLPERVQELHDRLVAWSITTDTEFKEVWDEAYNRFQTALAVTVNPLESPSIMLIEAFEATLTTFDTIWLQSIEMAEMGEAFEDLDEEL